MRFILAQAISAVSFMINVAGMQFNDRKKILLSVVWGGITSITSLCLLGAFSGGWMQIIFTLQAISARFVSFSIDNSSYSSDSTRR